MACIRRLTLALVLVALAWLGYSPDAQAACNEATYVCATREEAYNRAGANTGVEESACVNGGQVVVADEHGPEGTGTASGYAKWRRCRTNNGSWFPWDRPLAPGNPVWGWSQECPADKPWNESTKTCGAPKCPAGESSGPRPGTSDNVGLVGGLRCQGECEVVYQRNGLYIEGIMTGAQCTPDDYKCPPGTTSTLEPGVGLVCFGERQCPPGQQKDPATGQCMKPAVCPEGQVKDADGNCQPRDANCPAGQVKGPDGSCVRSECPAGQAKGSDGTCKPDADGDGKPDDGDEGEDGQGEYGDSTDCNVPPRCSGDNVMCGQVLISWRIECNTRKKATIAGGHCAAGAAPPICEGDGCNAQAQAQLIQQWRATCALEKLREGSGSGDAGQPEWTKVTGMSQNPGEGQTPGDVAGVDDREIGVSDLNSSGWLGGGGSCPSFAGLASGSELSSAFMQDLVNPPAIWCNYIAMARAVILLLAAIAAVYIVSRGS